VRSQTLAYETGSITFGARARVTIAQAIRLLHVTMQPVPRPLTQAVALQCLDARGRSIDLPARLGYDVSDPWAVAITFGDPSQEVTWLVGRDLLMDGLTEPTGEGDILLWPSIDDQGRAAVVMELCSPHGRLVAQLGTRELSEFLARTMTVVPQGSESVDLDRLVDELMSAH
jgi:hypothetical protein